MLLLSSSKKRSIRPFYYKRKTYRNVYLFRLSVFTVLVLEVYRNENNDYEEV